MVGLEVDLALSDMLLAIPPDPPPLQAFRSRIRGVIVTINTRLDFI